MMKMIWAALLVAATCCFAPGMSLYIPDGNKYEEGTAEKLSCLEKPMEARKENASIVLINFLCTCAKYMDPKNKEELIEVIRDIQDVTGCTQRDFLGSDSNIEELVNELDGTLPKLKFNVEELLKRLLITDVPKLVCVLLDNVKKNADPTLETSDPSGHKRLARSLGGLGGTLGGLGTLLSVVNNLSPLLDVVGKLGGTVGSVASPVLGIVNNLLGGLLQDRGLLGSLLGGSQGGLLPDLLNGGLLGSLLGGGGLLGGGLGGLLGGGQGCGTGGNLVTGLTSGLLGGNGILGGLLAGGQGQALGGLLGGVSKLAGDITGGVLGGNESVGGSKGQGAGGLLGGLLGGNGMVGGLLGGGGPVGGLLGGLLGGNSGGGLLGL